MQQCSLFCPQCEANTLHGKREFSAAIGCFLSLFTCGLFLPFWLLLSVACGLSPWRCQTCGTSHGHSSGSAQSNSAVRAAVLALVGCVLVFAWMSKGRPWLVSDQENLNENRSNRSVPVSSNIGKPTRLPPIFSRVDLWELKEWDGNSWVFGIVDDEWPRTIRVVGGRDYEAGEGEDYAAITVEEPTTGTLLVQRLNKDDSSLKQRTFHAGKESEENNEETQQP